MKIQKHIICLTATVILMANLAHSQYCVPLTAIPYNANMPGITRFKLGTINRLSADIEHFPANNYVFTDSTTNLNVGGTYPITIVHTIDPAICPDMNLRVWVDFNHDLDFLDPGELVLSENNDPAGSFVDSFTVPQNALLGPTRLRCTAKMSSLGGHTLPTPCDNPPDPFGYHGEIEDYTLNILAPVSGTNSAVSKLASVSVSPNPASRFFSINYTLDAPSLTSISLINIWGQHLKALQPNAMTPAGQHRFQQETSDLAAGIYLIRLQVDDAVVYQKLVVN